ncbi:HutD/Ves family protein [Frateuria hangzhouensis]|uniref:HutD/Ves family protein n=1 Tax=Frateuria hangzhouensis TaxID=2995589 RepID=UPI002260BB0F|nr:HutD family protein [Frateuria sp. STR12]MCX7514523.1 HutD family protein [Frateuria sp. STR12]
MSDPILNLRDCPARSWKNGQGRTRELAVDPPGAGMDDFLWRVSVAEVDSAAPFSAFPGIDRTIVLLDGAGFAMALGDGRTHALTEPFAPFAFPGEAQVAVTLAGGATRDFNLMVRRQRARGKVSVWRDPADVVPGPHTVLLYCAQGRLQLDDLVLEPGDAWRHPTAAPVRATLAPGSAVLAVDVASCG